MHTETTPRFPGENADDQAERRLRIARVLLERAGDDLEQMENDADGDLQAGLGDALMLVLLATEELPTV